MTEQTERPLSEPRPTGEVRTWPRSFADRLTSPLPGVRALARLAREGMLRPGAEALREVSRLPVVPGAPPAVDAAAVAVTWAGHASWVVGIGGLTVLTDPVWSRRILGTPPRITPVGVRWEDLPPVDAVVISHNHYDHLDAPTLKRLPRHTHLLLPAGLGRWARRRGFTRVTELDWWEAVELPGAAG
ncbi:MBL fold metallo-hydrolase, partial [Streptomyces huiliensis]|uniref:MBL fold metallo-hydrolase n=1 Tax=Streptomyces huiliensis TaxID=2876027 RepID=UPI001CBE6C50